MKEKNREQDDTLNDLLFSNELYLVIAFYLIAFFIRLFFLAVSDNFAEQQPMLKLITVLHIISFPALSENIYYQHLPFYSYLLAFLVWLVKEQILAGRFLSLLFGSLTIIPFYYLIKTIFDKKIAIFSAIFACFSPGHILKSIITLPDVIAIFFIIISIYLLLNKKLFFASLSLNIACGFDYFAWFFIIILPLSILLQHEEKPGKRIKDSIGFFLIAIIFPVFWSMLIKYKYQTVLLFYNHSVMQLSFAKGLFLIMTNIQKLFVELLLSRHLIVIFFLGLVGALSAYLRKKHMVLIFFMLSLILFASVGFFHQEISIISQSEVLIILLFYPFIVIGIFLGLSIFRRHKDIYARTTILVVLFYLLFLAYQVKPTIPNEIKRLSSWLKENLNTKEIIFITKDKSGYYSAIIMYSGLPQGNFCIINNNKDIGENIYKLIRQKRGYFVALKSGQFPKLNQPFKKITSFKMHKIFKLNSSI